MKESEYVDSLISEYATFLSGYKDAQGREAKAKIIENLVASADWTRSGARELVRLADSYGAFMLRNALAIAVVLGKEDGTKGF